MHSSYNYSSYIKMFRFFLIYSLTYFQLIYGRSAPTRQPCRGYEVQPAQRQWYASNYGNGNRNYDYYYGRNGQCSCPDCQQNRYYVNSNYEKNKDKSHTYKPSKPNSCSDSSSTANQNANRYRESQRKTSQITKSDQPTDFVFLNDNKSDDSDFIDEDYIREKNRVKNQKSNKLTERKK
ncbi:uncharacterized protein LOC142318051 [Lycorma delicatula]|uniref:uncharacterized protein LOC142318051 n=1 Tax=Lycorma delicatula TaxID=130591 RepID=UPI003F51A5E2